MTKTIKTLIKDIYDVIEGKGGWDKTVEEFFLSEMGIVLHQRLNEEHQARGTLRLSNLGTPCDRQLWYRVNEPSQGERLPPHTRFKFLYGDMLECLVLALAKAAGHEVTGLQTTLEVFGITGHRDAVIDGVTVDVKSASQYSFDKFKSGSLRDSDSFGYISQLSSYVSAAEEGVDPVHGAFLVVNKVSGQLHLDYYDFSEEIERKEDEVKSKIAVVEGEIPARGFTDVPVSASSPNKKLGINCSYCDHKFKCWPEVRLFLYGHGPQYLTVVEKEPSVFEVAPDIEGEL